MRLYTRVLLATILFATIGAAAAAEFKPPSTDQTMSLLATGRYEELDRLMQGVQDQYTRGAISDEQLIAGFRVFRTADPKLTPLFDKWVEQRPKSYPALLARGMNLKYIGWEARGEEFISKTSPEQLQRMEAAFGPAMVDLRASLALESKPLLSFFHLVDISNALGLDELERDFMRAAEKIDPKNVVVRRKFLGGLQTRWGGSVEEMRDFVNECRRIGLPADTLREFEREVVRDQAWVYLYREENYEAAERTYEQLAQDPEDVGAMRSLVWARVKLGKLDAAIAAAGPVLEHDPKDKWTLTQRGWCYMQQKKGSESLRDYLAAAELGHAPAQRELGRMYWHGRFIPQDRAGAIAWMKKAAEQGDEGAQKDLYWALQQYQPPAQQ